VQIRNLSRQIVVTTAKIIAKRMTSFIGNHL
jgi:hypothetical protein